MRLNGNFTAGLHCADDDGDCDADADVPLMMPPPSTEVEMEATMGDRKRGGALARERIWTVDIMLGKTIIAGGVLERAGGDARCNKRTEAEQRDAKIFCVNQVHVTN